MVKFDEPYTSEELLKLLQRVRNTEVIPSDEKKGIILPLYKGQDDWSECKNYKAGITLSSVPGKVFPRILLELMKPAIEGSRRREQSGSTQEGQQSIGSWL